MEQLGWKYHFWVFDLALQSVRLTKDRRSKCHIPNQLLSQWTTPRTKYDSVIRFGPWGLTFEEAMIWYDSIPTSSYSPILYPTTSIRYQKWDLLVAFFDSFSRLSFRLVICVLCYPFRCGVLHWLVQYHSVSLLSFFASLRMMTDRRWNTSPNPKSIRPKDDKKSKRSIQLREFRISGTERHFALLVPCYRFLDFMIYVVCCMCITWLSTQSSRTSYSQWSPTVGSGSRSMPVV